MPTVFGPIDLLKNELRNAVMQNLGVAPVAPAVGQIFYNTATGEVQYWDGGTWIAAKAAPGATPAGSVTNETIGVAGVVGTSTNYARQNHIHGMPAFAVVTAATTFGLAAADGVAATLARSDHTHGSPVHTAAQHTTFSLSTFAAPTADIPIGNFKLTGLGTPVANTDSATKGYVDGLVSGLSWKDPVLCATTVNVGRSGLAAIDGVTPVANDRILVKNQTLPQENGIYLAAAGAWTRSLDADTDVELASAALFVRQGTTQADTAWVQQANLPITVGTTPLSFVQFGAGATYLGGAGILLTGNVFSINAGTGVTIGADDVSVNFGGTGVAVTASRTDHDHNATYAPLTRTLTTTAPLTGGGTLAADRTLAITSFAGAAAGAVPVSVGGTVNFLRADGAWATPPTAVAGAGLTLTGSTIDLIAADTSLTVTANDVAVNTGIIATRAYADGLVVGLPKKYSQVLGGSGSPETVTHNLGTRDVIVQVFNGNTPWQQVQVDVAATTINSVTLTYSPALGAGFRCVVLG